MHENGPIIFIDDDADDHYLYREICSRLQLPNEVKCFDQPEHLLHYLRSTPDQPFIIFCDINMPEIDGLQLRRRIDSEEYLRHKSIPFIFYSTAASPNQVREAYDMTIQGFFLKEHNFSDTVATFRVVIDYWKKCKHPNSGLK